MNRIEHEIELLINMAAEGKLPGYPVNGGGDSFFTEAPVSMDMGEYFSGENDALESRIKAMWANDPELQKCIPLIIAAVEKTRGQDGHAIVPTELYNYAM